MNQVDDHWMRPRTKAGTEEMRKRLKVMRELLQAAARHSIESEVAHKVFDEYFSFDWDDEAMDKKFENIQTEKKKVALPDRC